MIKRVLTLLLFSGLIFADAPDWQVDIPAYQYNGSVTSAVYLNDEVVGSENDMLAGFVGDEVRGVVNGLLFPVTGEYSFNLLLYSNLASGETITFKYYHSSSDQIFDLNETLAFESDMIIGNAIAPFLLNGYGDTSGSDDDSSSNLCSDDSSSWVINPADFQYNGSVTSAIYLNDEITGSENDILAGFVGDEVRGVVNGLLFPVTGEYSFNLLLFSNVSSGETITFKYFNAASGQVFCLDETLDFESDMIIGNAFSPFEFYAYGEVSDPIFGCMDESACNYNSEATVDDDSCEFAEENFDCEGNCLINVDCNGVCGGDAELDECGTCDALPFNDCVQDCAGNWGGDAVIDECGICDGPGAIYECGCADLVEGECDCDGNVLDECGDCGGSGYFDECGVCDSLPFNDCEQDCSGEWGGTALEDECGVCEGDNSTCTGCTDSEALNYDETAIIDDGSCIFDGDLPPQLFEFSQSTEQAFYFFEIVSIDSTPVDSDDWVGAFNGDVCVGSRKWDTSLCSNNVCELTVMGDDGEDYSLGYMQNGQTPKFKIYDSSEGAFYDAVASEDNLWENNATYVVNSLDVLVDCAGDLGGDAVLDECGVCDGLGSVYECGCSDIAEGECDCEGNVLDDCGDCGGNNAAQDECGICDGTGPEENFDCDGNCLVEVDCNGVCGGFSELDECGVCDGGGIADGECDCLGNILDECGECGGLGYIDECGICDNDSSNDCVQDCNGTWGGIVGDSDSDGLCDDVDICPDDPENDIDGDGLCCYNDIDFSIPSNYTLFGTFNGSSYYLSDQRLTWQDAKIAAEQLGGYLVSINSEEENNFLGGLPVEDLSPTYQIAIGLIYENEIYSWLDGTTAEFFSWRSDMPRGYYRSNFWPDASLAGVPGELNVWTDGQINEDLEYYVVEIPFIFDSCCNDPLNDIDGDGVCGDLDECPNDAENDADDDGVCADEEVFGCTDESALNFAQEATEDDDSCYYTIVQDMDLHDGLNLVSFYTLPDDRNLDGFFNSAENTILDVLTEGSAALNVSEDGSYNWIGSLTSIEEAKGYWLNTSQQTFSLEGFPLSQDLEYSLHTGPNLISFPDAGSYSLSDVLPDQFEGVLYGILGEGEVAVYDNGSWVGSLENLSGGDGYWFKSLNDISLTFDFSSALPRLRTQKDYVLSEYEFNQSTQQAFYFIREIQGVLDGDWILAFNDNQLVGYRKWQGEMTDVPAMGKDAFAYTLGYCEDGDVPNFKLFREATGELINLYGSVDEWSNNDISIIESLYLSDNIGLPSEITINKVYPNPFNPITNIDFYLPNNADIKLNILNINGRKVKELMSGNYSTGNYNIQVDGSDLSSGIYFIELTDGFNTQYSKIILLK